VVVVWGELDKQVPLPGTVDGVPIVYGRDLASRPTGQDSQLDSSLIDELAGKVRHFANRQHVHLRS